MKNPADSRTYYHYTAHEIACSGDIVSAPHLFPPQWVTWANKVVKWAAKFGQLLRAYTRIIGDGQIAMKAIWDNLRKGMSVVSMLRQTYYVGHEAAKWVHPRFSRTETKQNGHPITYIRPKSGKTERRIRNTNIKNNLQTI